MYTSNSVYVYFQSCINSRNLLQDTVALHIVYFQATASLTVLIIFIPAF